VTTLYETAFSPGARIRGKWNGRLYIVERQLGAGANGFVVLVRRGRSFFALKAGFEMVDHQSEINVLRMLSRTETSFRHYLIDVDDFVLEGKSIPFSVMRYIEGVTLPVFLRTHGSDWIYIIGTKLLKKLTELHQSGFIFGDLKLDNMLVFGHGDVELIDFGGVTRKGQSIKQLTEIYDRGYWDAGNRVAEESYDLFAFAVLILNALDDQDRFAAYRHALPQNRRIEELHAMIQETPLASPVAPFLIKALQGQMGSSQDAFRSWRTLAAQRRGTGELLPTKTSWLHVGLAGSLLLFGVTIYIYWLH
jgi:serine/threonine protein kinase